MDDLGDLYKRVKLAIGVISGAILGVTLIALGDVQSIVIGVGTLLASAIVLALLLWSFRGPITVPGSEGPLEANDRPRVFWLGLLLTALSGLFCLYLRYAMVRFDPVALFFVSMPLLISGLVCICVGLWSARKSDGQPTEWPDPES
jgi:hypothetical protein